MQKLGATRCFIDADGTLFNSLPYYNEAFDTLFFGKLTDRKYDTYRGEIDRIYDFIPGSPWKNIIAAGYEYLTGKNPSDDELDRMEQEFEASAVDVLSNVPLDALMIEPVIRFCHEYKDMGGSLVIHSGTNRVILEAMLKHCDIYDLFDDYLTSNMMLQDNFKSSELSSQWGYKTALLRRLINKYPINGKKDFVIGDTKGDAFGAKEIGVPFLLVWRGYPRDPYKLSANHERTEFMSPDAVVDMRDDIIADDINAMNATQDMIDFALRLAEN